GYRADAAHRVGSDGVGVACGDDRCRRRLRHARCGEPPLCRGAGGRRLGRRTGSPRVPERPAGRPRRRQPGARQGRIRRGRHGRRLGRTVRRPGAEAMRNGKGLSAMIDRLMRKGREIRHLRAARGVLATPPIAPTRDPVLIFSMIGTRVVLPYLVAVKSFHARLGVGRVAILDAGTLTAADRAVLAHHLADPTILSIDAVKTGSCPVGGCWERLLALLDMTSDNYIVQLDSDTVTIGDVPEVAEAIATNRSFTLLGDALAE